MLTTRDLRFSYTPGRPVLEGISLECTPGVNVIIGPNAAGKSTLLRLLAGLLVPTGGSADFDERPVSSISPPDRARRLAYIAQRPIVTADFRVRDVVALGRFSAAADTGAVQSAMLAAEVDALAERRFAELSVGQQQRVALARAIAQLTPLQHGKVLLADEPIAAMDPEHALATCERLRTLGAAGLCVVAVLHDLTMAMRVADRVIVLGPGGVLAGVSPPSEALALDRLERVFHTRFSRAQTAGGPVVVAEERLGDTSAPRAGI